MLYFVLPICYQFWFARKYAFVQHSPGKQLFAPLAQLAEQVTLNHWVAGSIPARCTSASNARGAKRKTPSARFSPRTSARLASCGPSRRRGLLLLTRARPALAYIH